MCKVMPILTTLLVLLLIGCSRIPKGYSKDQWELYKQANPSEAKVLEWVAQDSRRERAREAEAMISIRPEFVNGDKLRDGSNLYVEFDRMYKTETARTCLEKGYDYPERVKALLQSMYKELEEGPKRDEFERRMATSNSDKERSVQLIAEIDSRQPRRLQEIERLKGIEKILQ